MVTNVVVTADENGVVFHKNEKLGKDGKEYGYIRLSAQRVDLSGSVATVKNISALKTFKVEDWNKLGGAIQNGTSLRGQIIIKESLQKIGNAQPKRAGSDENAELCTLGGMPIYRYTYFTEDMSAQDELIKHDNVIVGTTTVAKKAIAVVE